MEGPARKGEGMFMGRTRGFRKVVFPGNKRMVGELLDITIELPSVTVLKGTPVLTEETFSAA